MTVGELRKALECVPDDLMVLLDAEEFVFEVTEARQTPNTGIRHPRTGLTITGDRPRRLRYAAFDPDRQRRPF
jgi:hypothetical protein